MRGKIVLLGAGGHCKVIIELIRAIGTYEIAGILAQESAPKQVMGVPVIGDDDELPRVFAAGITKAFICIGNLSVRDRLFEKLQCFGFTLPVLIHPTAYISPSAIVAEGTCVLAHAIVNTGACIGQNCIINTAAVVEHDCALARNVHISPNAALAGGVKIGSNTHIGLGAAIIQKCQIGKGVTIGAGAVVIHNVPDFATAIGVPAKVISYKECE
ncbi:MAG: acetyltransferase [Sporolactobacillus sp.]